MFLKVGLFYLYALFIFPFILSSFINSNESHDTLGDKFFCDHFSKLHYIFKPL